MTPTPLIDLFIRLHRAEFDRSDWWKQQEMIKELYEINDDNERGLFPYILELERDSELGKQTA